MVKPTGNELLIIQRSTVPTLAETSTRRGSKRCLLIKPLVTSSSKVRSWAILLSSIAVASVLNDSFIFLLNAEISPSGRSSKTVLSAKSLPELKTFLILSKKPRFTPEISDTPSPSLKLTSTSARSPGARIRELIALPCDKKPKSLAMSNMSCSLSKRRS